MFPSPIGDLFYLMIIDGNVYIDGEILFPSPIGDLFYLIEIG